ncbi:hypothetical protein Pmar_PMAR027923 [Perkinsus marinus ATCC 50983]|uniref:Uncharacterized protein n=1 Tax=Perkinsus marinus (strain ATCC 50983 / TXsc) TaxID=423536 RepID=C5LDF1_PERM5|nr:hypothetical protein Pmar_PMAR027923 [Perkinsus marinus ATCC 50983]EER05283.1 hypothetical protein Pmar_PMAR027923 [Perkinsus marinus ATCC 50983]|eukprot:XP_002773467.1 hypothetical protein Pmar_PMAR027923 [Perkinsus marinus ATCC 50983]
MKVAVFVRNGNNASRTTSAAAAACGDVGQGFKALPFGMALWRVPAWAVATLMLLTGSMNTLSKKAMFETCAPSITRHTGGKSF